MPRLVFWMIAVALLLFAACDSPGESFRISSKSNGFDGGSFSGVPHAAKEINEETQDKRQIQRKARLAIKVDDFSKAGEEIRKHLKNVDGYLARNEQKRESENSYSGTLLLRVPVASYPDTLEFLRGLGKIYELFESAEDMTDNLIDMAARLANAKRLERRILAIIDEETGSISQIIEAERELSAVRGRIEELEGRQKSLEKKVRYASFTVNLFVSSSRDVEARTWYGPLLHDLRDLGFIIAGSIGALLTVIVAALPWLFLVWGLWHWRKKRTSRKPKLKKNDSDD